MHGQNNTDGAVRSVEQVTTALRWRAVAPPVLVVGEPTSAQRDALRDLGATLAATIAG